MATPLTGLRGTLLALAFLLELCALVGAALGAFALVDGPAGLVLALAVVGLLAVGWGVLVSPKARHPLAGLPRLGFVCAWVLVCAVGLGWAVSPAAGLALCALWAAVNGLLRVVGRAG